MKNFKKFVASVLCLAVFQSTAVFSLPDDEPVCEMEAGNAENGDIAVMGYILEKLENPQWAWKYNTDAADKTEENTGNPAFGKYVDYKISGNNDTAYAFAEVGGKKALYSASLLRNDGTWRTGQLSFAVNSGKLDYNCRRIRIETEYFDNGEALYLTYVNGESGGKHTTETKIFKTSGENKWKTAVFDIDNAYLNYPIYNESKKRTEYSGFYNGKPVFRFSCSKPVYISKIRIFENNFAEAESCTDASTDREYKKLFINGKNTERAYFTKGMWTCDSKNLILCSEEWLYKYNLESGKVKRLVKSDANFYVSKGNYLYYYDAENKTINRMNLESFEKEVLTARYSGEEFYANGTPFSIHVNDSDTFLTALCAVVSYDAEEEKLNWSYNEDGSRNKRIYRRIAIFDIKNKKWDLSRKTSFPMSAPEMTHLMINPQYDNLFMFAHEGDASLISDRINVLNLKTEKTENVFIQQPAADTGSGITGEACGHENWTADGEHIVFVKYPHASNVGKNGIVRIDKYGNDREYLNDDYDYWHCHPSSDNRFIVADTIMENSENGTQTEDMKFGKSKIVLVDSKSSKSYVIAKIKAGSKHPYQPHPSFSPDGKWVSFGFADENERLGVGIMNISDLANGKNSESFIGNSNEDKGFKISEITETESGFSVSAEAVADGAKAWFLGAEQGLSGELKSVDKKDISLNKGERISLNAKGEKAFLWLENLEPLSEEPSAPQCLKAKCLKKNKLKISWVPPKNLISEGVEYEIWRNGELAGKTKDLFFDDGNAETGTEYLYEVRAVYPGEKKSSFGRLYASAEDFEAYSYLSGSVLKEDGINFLERNNKLYDTYTEAAEAAGEKCRKSTVQYVNGEAKYGKFYFKARKSVFGDGHRKLLFTVRYFDNGTENIYVEYNAEDGNASKKALLAKKTGTEKWIEKSVEISDAKFVRASSLTGCDFRISGGDGLYISHVKLKNAE